MVDTLLEIVQRDGNDQRYGAQNTIEDLAQKRMMSKKGMPKV